MKKKKKKTRVVLWPPIDLAAKQWPLDRSGGSGGHLIDFVNGGSLL